jgi:hypothetical protein
MRFLLGAAVALASAQPALAAGLHDDSQTGRRSGAFAGATFRVGLDGRRSEEARPRLAFSISRIDERLGASGRVERFTSPGLELTFTGARPQFLVGGMSFSESRQRLGVAPGIAVLAVAGVAAAAAAMSSMGSADKRDEQDELERRQCFLPEGCS